MNEDTLIYTGNVFCLDNTLLLKVIGWTRKHFTDINNIRHTILINNVRIFICTTDLFIIHKLESQMDIIVIYRCISRFNIYFQRNSPVLISVFSKFRSYFWSRKRGGRPWHVLIRLKPMKSMKTPRSVSMSTATGKYTLVAVSVNVVWSSRRDKETPRTLSSP